MDTIKSVVQKVVREGKHGPFAVTTSDQIEGSVTFSLEPTVWQEEDWPEEGTMVFLGKLREKRAGWRAKLARFWKPSDEQKQQIERSKQMIEFLYPISRQFPFDEVCEKIVRELELRNWNVPGMTVEFHEYGSGEQKFRAVEHIKSLNFKLWFCRVQRLMPGGRYNDTAAVTEIVIPKKELHVYEDESGPSFYTYVGNNWAQDREKFMYGSKVNSKLNGEPRLYLKYKGVCCCGSTQASFGKNIPHTHPGRRSPILVHDNDLGREYEPQERGKWNWLEWQREPGEPKEFITAMVMYEFTKWLEQNVLAVIMSHPVPTERIDAFPPEQIIPFPEAVGPLFAFGEENDWWRIAQGKADPKELDPSDRSMYLGSSARLACLGTNGDFPKIAYEGFQWCGIGAVASDTDINSLEVPGQMRWDRQRFVIRVTPNRANHIYIADHSVYEKRRKEICDAITDERDRLTNDEVSDFTAARARTIIPIAEYKGGFEQPIVLINRELSFDEVEVISGPHKGRHIR